MRQCVVQQLVHSNGGSTVQQMRNGLWIYSALALSPSSTTYLLWVLGQDLTLSVPELPNL